MKSRDIKKQGGLERKTSTEIYPGVFVEDLPKDDSGKPMIPLDTNGNPLIMDDIRDRWRKPSGKYITQAEYKIRIEEEGKDGRYWRER